MERVRRGWADTPFWRFLGIEALEAAEGYCRLRLKVRPGMVNSDDRTVHGGILASLVDAAVGAVLWTVYDVGREIHGHTTIELNISYVRPARGAEVFVEGRVVRKGRSLMVGEAEIKNADGTLAATGRATYMVFS